MKKFRRLIGKTDKRMKGQQPRSIWSLYEFFNPFRNRRIGIFYPRMPFLNSWVYHGRSWCLSKCHIQGLEKWISLRCLIFKEFLFLGKGLELVPSFWPNYENKSLEPDRQISSQCPIRRFLTVFTNFLGALSQKRKWWLFRK